MIKVILFDCDGVIVKETEKYFRHRMVDELGIKVNQAAANDFFRNEFLLCETGKLDLKEELVKHLPLWNIDWPVDKVLDYWFSGEAERDEQLVEAIKLLRGQGTKCFLSTNNEKYRTEYLAQTVGLGQILDGIFSSASTGYLKPDLNFWQQIYKQLPDYDKQEILVFDNNRPMSESAAEFGFNSELYTGYEKFINQIRAYNLLNG